jgi:hypothetical protein
VGREVKEEEEREEEPRDREEMRLEGWNEGDGGR